MNDREKSQENAAQAYREGKTTLTDAAKRSGLTLWNFQGYLVDKGFVSKYSVEDLLEELDPIYD